MANQQRTHYEPHPYYPLVTLKDDRAFRGYSFGNCVDADGQLTGEMMVSVSSPSDTQLRGCVRLAADRLEVIG